MPRQQRLVEPGVYHVVNRGVEQRNIYLDAADYQQGVRYHLIRPINSLYKIKNNRILMSILFNETNIYEYY